MNTWTLTALYLIEGYVAKIKKQSTIETNSARLIPENTPLDEAELLRKTDDPTNFACAVLTEEEVRNLTLPKRKYLVEGLIKEESITIINGFRGEGKSWFVMAIANEITWGGKMGSWKINNPVNTLIVDGEMPIDLIQDRIKRMNIGRGYLHKPAQLFIYPECYAYRIGLHRANLLDPQWRKAILDIVTTLDIGFLVLDNLSSLAPGIDENSKVEFDPVNRWLLELRFHKTAIAMTHHVGKSGEQRGTTCHEDHVDVSLMLKRPRGYREEDGCKFICRVDKDRTFITQGKQFCLQLVELESGRLEFATVESEDGKGMRLFQENPNLTKKEALEMGISKATYYRTKKKFYEDGTSLTDSETP